MSQQILVLDFLFQKNLPIYGDLFKMVGFENPDFESKSNVFLKLESLNIEYIDDFFGIENMDYEGDDVAIWIHPIQDGVVQTRQSGSFDGLRVSYNVLRNSLSKAKILEKLYVLFTKNLQVNVFLEQKMVSDYKVIQEEFARIRKYWETFGLEMGSDEALEYNVE
jgi:hypothetical protein